MTTRYTLRLIQESDIPEAVRDYLVEEFEYTVDDAERLIVEGGPVFATTDPETAERHEAKLEERGGDVRIVESKEPDRPDEPVPDDGEIPTTLSDVGGDSVLQFMVTRPAQRAGGVVPVPYDEGSLVVELDQAKWADDPRMEMAKIAADYVTGHDYVESDASLDTALFIFGDQIEADQPDSLAELETIAEETFDEDLDDLVASDAFLSDRENLRDSLAAVNVLPGRPPAEHERIGRGLRLVDLVERLADEDPSLDNERAIRDAMRRQVSLPVSLSAPGTTEVILKLPEEEESDISAERMEWLQDRLKTIREARSDIESFEGTSIEIESDGGVPMDARERGGGQPGLLESWLGRTVRGLVGEDIIDAVVGGGAHGQFGSGQDRAAMPQLGEPTNWTLSEDAIGNLSAETHSVLEELDLRATETPVPDLVAELERAESTIGTELYSSQLGSLVTEQLQFGNITLPRDPSFMVGEWLDVWTNISPYEDAPASAVHPLGIGDMYTLQQTTNRYLLGDLAHVENIMQSEHKNRTHRRARETEETIFEEAETTEETEKDLLTAERFSTERSMEEVSKQELAVDAGLKVSASYGPTIEVEAYTDVSSTTARESSRRAAQSYARNVSNRTVESVKRRILERTVRRTKTEFEETNEHGFDNSDGDAHIAGLYRFVDKELLSTTLKSTEPRMMFEFIVPEPAAFYRHAMAETASGGDVAEEPREPVYIDIWGDRDEQVPLEPQHLSLQNYRYYLREYDADVNPPPTKFRTASHNFKREVQETSDFPYYDETKLSLPPGYWAKYAAYTIQEIIRSEDDQEDWYIELDFGKGWQRLHGANDNYAGVQNLTGNLGPGINVDHTWTGEFPITLGAWKTWGYAATVSVLCERMDETYEQWQLDTFQSIMDAYRAAKAAYDDAQTAASIGEGVQIAGRAPAHNRVTERNELKKHAIAMLRNVHFNVDSIEDAQETGDFPQVDLDVVGSETEAIQFFEQAFEWSAMTYVFYPYYWSRRSEWETLVGLEEADPLFLHFLTAGAARIVVPVRPGYDEEVLWFMEHEEMWGGEEKPTVNDPEFVPIAEEVRAQQGGLSNYEPVDSETFTLPTDLVKLQEGQELPDFRADDGMNGGG